MACARGTQTLQMSLRFEVGWHADAETSAYPATPMPPPQYWLGLLWKQSSQLRPSSLTCQPTLQVHAQDVDWPFNPPVTKLALPVKHI